MNKFRFYWDVMSPTLGILFISAIMFFVVGLPKLNLLQTFGLSVLISLLAPRKIDMGKKEKTNNTDEDLNKNLEDLLHNLSSNFRA